MVYFRKGYIHLEHDRVIFTSKTVIYNIFLYEYIVSLNIYGFFSQWPLGYLAPPPLIAMVRCWSRLGVWVPMARGGARNFCLEGPICVANLLVYINFYTHIQIYVFIHTHKISIFHNESLKLNVS